MSGLEIIEKYQIPDKPDFYATTSHKFKLDLLIFLMIIRIRFLLNLVRQEVIQVYFVLDYLKTFTRLIFKEQKRQMNV